MNRCHEALECYKQGLDEAKTCFDQVEAARTLRAIARTKWKEVHALKVFTSIAGPLFRSKNKRFHENFPEVIQCYVKAELHGRDVMDEAWLKESRQQYKECLDDLLSITKIALMSHKEWMQYLFQTLESMALGDPMKCDMYYKITNLQSEAGYFDDALGTLKKCISLIEDSSTLGISTKHYTSLIAQSHAN